MRFLSCILASACLAAAPTPAGAREPRPWFQEWEIYLGARVGADRGEAGLWAYPEQVEPSIDAYLSLFPSILVQAGIRGSAELVVRIEPGELAYTGRGFTIGGRKPLDVLREDWAFREAFVELAPGESVAFKLGKQLAELGRGMIFYDAVLGISAVLGPTDTGDTFVSYRLLAGFPDAAFMPYRTEQGYYCNFEEAVCTQEEMRIPTRKSWLAAGTVRVEPSMFEWLELTAAAYSDRGGGFNELLKPWLKEKAARALQGNPYLREVALNFLEGNQEPSSGDLLYLSLSGRLITDLAVLDYTLAFCGGKVSLTLPALVPGHGLAPMRSRLWSTGYGADVSAQFQVLDMFSLEPFFTFMSGDSGPEQRKNLGSLDMFIGPSTRLYRTNIFFQGGLNRSYLTRKASAAGLAGKGVIAFGLEVEAAAGRDFTFALTTAALSSHKPSNLTGGRYYGTEADLLVQYEALEGLELGLEADVLVQGGFMEKPGTIFRLMLAADWTY